MSPGLGHSLYDYGLFSSSVSVLVCPAVPSSTSFTASFGSFPPDSSSIRLLELGANAKLKNEDGKTAFDYADRIKGSQAYWLLNEARY